MSVGRGRIVVSRMQPRQPPHHLPNNTHYRHTRLCETATSPSRVGTRRLVGDRSLVLIRLPRRTAEDADGGAFEAFPGVAVAGLGLDDAPAARAALQRQQAAVQLLQAGAVADAEDGRLRKPLEQQRQQPELAVDVERRCRFVHDDDVGLVDQQPRERDALALAARQRLVPALLLGVELARQIAEAHSFRTALARSSASSDPSTG